MGMITGMNMSTAMASRTRTTSIATTTASKSFCMTFDEPMSWSTVAAAFDALVTYRGPDLCA
jgi:hypothetical protein